MTAAHIFCLRRCQSVRHMLAALAVLAITGAARAEPVDVDGLYMMTPEADCSVLGLGGALKIEDGVFYGAESRCEMQDPVEIRDMRAALYDMQCKGEGTEWSERAMVMRAADDGLILVWDGYAFHYQQCVAPPVLGATAATPPPVAARVVEIDTTDAAPPPAD
ncbi:hypothetical protein [Pacificitalea manganoxidans]|uniref:hypothetical protein n=1 Tax=Pacificitalea manganoxidans TaxID=1411902 RepID=UPI000BE3CFDC|nr:hypothetical protein [Pacificitalea manganoxidans]MDR6307270.1 hypothetical protein [Pacificitalea manganoxidans]